MLIIQDITIMQIYQQTTELLQKPLPSQTTAKTRWLLDDCIAQSQISR